MDLKRYGVQVGEKPHETEPTPEQFKAEVDSLVEKYGPNAGKKTEE